MAQLINNVAWTSIEKSIEAFISKNSTFQEMPWMSKQQKLALKHLIFRISKVPLRKLLRVIFFIHVRRFAEKSSTNFNFKPKTGVPDSEELEL